MFDVVLDFNHSVLLMLLLVSALVDAREHRIPNTIVLAGFIVGIFANSIALGLVGATQSLLGIVSGCLVLLPLYALRKMGAGDVKLMGVVGAFVGPVAVLWAVIWTFVAGGVLAVVWLLYVVGPKELFYRVVVMVSLKRELLSEPGSPFKKKMPYALAIALGTYLSWEFPIG